MGLVRSFQISAVFPHLTVLENVRIALQRKRGHSLDFWRSQRVLHELDARARELIEAVGLAQFEKSTAGELAYGRKRALEIATTLALEPEMMLLDEPTAGMTHEDVERIAALIKKVSANRSVLMVEHNLSVVSTLSDHITVLARGEVLAQGDYQSVSANPAVVERPTWAPLWLAQCRSATRRVDRDAAAQRARPAGVVRRIATSCTASRSTSHRAKSSRCSAATARARRRH
jgi:branched-chain amino acid transport system ATP-binding protein